MNHRNLLFVDVETTGLDDRKHEIIETAYILTSPDGSSVKQTYLARTFPRRLEDAQPDALRINGFTAESWRSGPLSTFAEVAAEIKSVSHNAILVGHNVSFDEGFLKALLLSENLEPSWHYHKVDTSALAWPLFSTGAVPGLALSKVCAALSIPQGRAHSADADALSCLRIYQVLMSRFTK